MLNKRGQFYLVGSIIIVIIIIGLLSLTTKVFIKSNPSIIYELGSQLNKESLSIVDYGIYQGEDINDLLSNFTEQEFAQYFLQKTAETQIAFIYGDESIVYLVEYNTTKRGSVSLGVGGSISSVTIIQTLVQKKGITGTPNQIEVQLLNDGYVFNLKPGENFYFVITYNKGQEIFVEESPS